MTTVDNSLTTQDAGEAGALSSGNFVSTIILSYLIAALVLVLLIDYVGTWEILAGTRFLDLLIAFNIVQFHDLPLPRLFVVPKLSIYYDSQYPLDWRVIFIAVLIFVCFSLVKATQFSSIARAYGVKGSFAQHVRAYLYGDGIDRFLPFYIGSVGTAAALAEQGARFDRALSAMVISHSFMIFEVAVFATIGLFFLGWSDWFSQLLWPLVMLGVVYLATRPDRRSTSSSLGGGRFSSIGRRTFVAGAQAFRALARKEPALLFKLCLLSVLAFALLDLGIYLVVEGFNTPERPYTSPFSALLMGIVGGYIARLIPVTPGGIGQFEFGFAAGFFAYGTDISFKLVLVALLATLLRSLTGCLLVGTVVVFFGAPTSLRSVIRIFRGAEPPPQQA